MIWLFCLSVDGGTVTCGIESLVHSRPNIGAKYDYMRASIWFIAVYKINTEQLAVGSWQLASKCAQMTKQSNTEVWKLRIWSSALSWAEKPRPILTINLASRTNNNNNDEAQREKMDSRHCFSSPSFCQFFRKLIVKTKNRLMVAFDSNKGPNLKVVKWC